MEFDMPKWLRDAVFYEIYPQSFYDANGDGIGDFEGIIQKLDYVKGLGCNALWLNPCFDSPFKDAGYDVRNYLLAAPRYGSNDDLERLFAEAHRRDLRVILDLVPGHTSEEHGWFKASARPEPNEFSGRYIWTSHCFEGAEGIGFIGGEFPRNGTYLINFFKCQPALNYGFHEIRRPWQHPVDHPDCAATREAMKDVMRFWLDRGCDGFRVDMAASLVKYDDENKTGTSSIWKNVRAMLDREYPEAALVAEWSDPPRSLKAGFHADFLLNNPGSGYRRLLRDYDQSLGTPSLEQGDGSFFRKDRQGDITAFLDDYLPAYGQTRHDGFISIITGNHDTVRLRFNHTPEELKLAFAVIFTLPGVPFLYYGDEIAMRYLDIPSKEGGYFRTGARTPMQWGRGKNLGFSAADPSALYLPVDGAADAPTVESEEKDPASLLNTLRAILRFRQSRDELHADPNLEVLYAEKRRLPFVYQRGKLVMAVNPSGQKQSAPVKAGDGRRLFAVTADGAAGAPAGPSPGSLTGGVCTVEGQSFTVFET
jgi:maltose alpha-D-glucosyltransferase/alpha-amylase